MARLRSDEKEKREEKERLVSQPQVTASSLHSLRKRPNERLVSIAQTRSKTLRTRRRDLPLLSLSVEK